VLQRLGFVDELRLRGRGRGMYVLGGLYALGAIGLIGLPYVGGFSGHSLLDDASRAQGRGWVAPLVVVAAAVASGAILRSAARIFLGWGDEQDPLLSPEPEEEPPGPKDMAYGPLIVPTALLVALGLAVSVVPGLEQRAEHAAGRFLDRATYAQHVLAAKPQQPLPHAPYEVRAASSESWAWGLAAGAIALATAAFGLWRRRVAAAVPRVARMLGPPTARLQALHSGVVGDYAMWITVGAAVLGGAWALTLR
jgi:multicomponent Na+:H+ antiporter subunit D